jgi:hypothetical protein
MTLEHADPDATFGYLSTWDSAEHGCLGGYLVVSKLGRPLEFHCTAPLRPSRAQQILFGPTLWPYVLGEQIGGTLIKDASLRPRIVLVDHSATLCLRSHVGVPMVRLNEVGNGQGEAESGSRELTACALTNTDSTNTDSTKADSTKADSTKADSTKLSLEVAGCELELPPGYEEDREIVVDLLTILAQHVALAEPFDRIHEAIREAQRLGGRGPQDVHEQAA